MQEFLLTEDEQIPKEFEKIELNDNHIFLSISRASAFYYDKFMASLIEPKNSQGLYFKNIKNKTITIIDFYGTSNSIFTGQLKKEIATGSIEGDVLKIFYDKIMVKEGNPAGFLRRPNPRYEENHKFKGQLRGRIYNNNKLEKEINFNDYITYLKTL